MKKVGKRWPRYIALHTLSEDAKETKEKIDSGEKQVSWNKMLLGKQYMVDWLFRFNGPVNNFAIMLSCSSDWENKMKEGKKKVKSLKQALAPLIARTTPLRKIEKIIDFCIVCKSTGLEKFIGVNCAQIGPFVETLSSFKNGGR